jgi:hypothetical protein
MSAALRKSPALATFERREDVVWFAAGVSFQRVAQHTDVGRIGSRERHLVVFFPKSVHISALLFQAVAALSRLDQSFDRQALV